MGGACGGGGKADHDSSAGAAGSAMGGSGGIDGAGGLGNAGTGATTGGQAGTAGAEAVCDSTCHFVRAGATGDGSDWDNALADLPAELERGHRYYVAAGDYAGYEFDDAESADSPITLHKATADRHGSDVGWLPEYAEGRARFGPLTFSRGRYVFDGQPGMGFEVVAEFQGDAVVIDADYVTLRNTDVNGNFETDASGNHNRGACTAMSISGTQIAVEANEIHDAADDGVSISGASFVSFTGNIVHRLHACGTDGGCGPCYNGHSDGIETYNVKHSQFVGNLVYDVRSTATLFFGNWADTLGNGPSEYCEDMLFANNIFYAPEVGLVAYIQDAARVYVYNNVFWGVRQGNYGGLSIGQHVTDLHLYNNVILSINMAHTGATFNANEHHGDYNLFGASLGQWTNGPNDIVAADPGFVAIPGAAGPAVADPTAADFSLKDGSPCVDAGFAGDATIQIPTTDLIGAARDSMPDIGALEKQP
jgi:hypothetical protein